jgi:hypothetical protein
MSLFRLARIFVRLACPVTEIGQTIIPDLSRGLSAHLHRYHDSLFDQALAHFAEKAGFKAPPEERESRLTVVSA